MGKTSEFEDSMTIILTLENDEELECMVVTDFEVEGKQYIALLPMEEDGSISDDAQVFLYRFSEDEDGEISIEYIDDDEEYEKAADRYDEILDEEEFNSLLEN